jgi:4-amino-4-deoxy-L-arabinose transferase-like glycosyltransferase
MTHPHDEAIEALLRQKFDGPVPDDGFSERVMQRLPSHRRRVTWPLWVGVLAGTGACWCSLLFAPWLSAGWRNWAHGELSFAAITLLVAMTIMSLLAGWWAMTEADDH